MATISVHKGTQCNQKHNNRTEKMISKEKHIHPKGTVYTDINGNEKVSHYEVWKDMSKSEACSLIFGEALTEYNKKQKPKHKERVIKDYVKHIEGQQKGNFVYEMLYGVYPEKNETITEEKQYQILKNIYTTFEQRNPNFKVIGAYYHADENGQPHLHLDYIPVAYNCSKGLKTQCSQNQALKQMGFELQKASNGIKSKYPITQWQEKERDYLIRLCASKGITAKVKKDEKKEHLEKELFIASRKIDELNNAISELNNAHYKDFQYQRAINHYKEQRDEIGALNAKIDAIKTGIEKLHEQHPESKAVSHILNLVYQILNIDNECITQDIQNQRYI